MSMAKLKKKSTDVINADRMKVQLNAKTFIVVKNMEAFERWKKLYPLAKILE